MAMSGKSLALSLIAACMLCASSCTPLPPKKDDAGPPPPQNMLGTTDELQLVTEVSLGLAKTYGADKILVVLEIDNTLLASAEGSKCHTGDKVLTQVDGPEQVRRMQDAGLNVIVLTSRAPDCRQQTLSDLRNGGFNFQNSAWPPRQGFPEPFLPEGASRPVLYQDGVFFTAGQNKGQMLKSLLEKSGEPRPLLFLIVDQRQDKLNEVMKIFSWTDTKVHAWRYTRDFEAPAIAES